MTVTLAAAVALAAHSTARSEQPRAIDGPAVAVALLTPPSLAVPTWASIAVAAGAFADCGPKGRAQQQAASREHGVVIVAGCGAAGARVTTAAGDVAWESDDLSLADAAPPNATVDVALPAVGGSQFGGNVSLAVLLGAQLWDPMFPRELMLQGAELLVSLDGSSSSSREGRATSGSVSHAPTPRTTLTAPQTLPEAAGDAMLLARGFENAAAVLRVGGEGGSALANWCNDMLAPGCAGGSALQPARSAVGGVSRVDFDLGDLRTQRASTIWGDAFRRPFTYQPLCFRGSRAEGIAGGAGAGSAGVPSPSSSSSSQSPSVSSSPPTGVDPFEVKVAILQMPACGNVSLCASEAEAQIRAAAAAGADVALTPEMWSMGYAAQWTAGSVAPGRTDQLRSAFAWTRLAQPLGGPYLSRVATLAKELGIAVAAGMMRSDEGDVGPGSEASLWPPHNSVVLVDRFGELVYIYDKVHTCDWSTEESLTTPGRQWHTGMLRTKGGNVTVGSMICADREFPESARTLALNGAEVVLTPNACGLVDAQLNQFRTRATENLMAVAMANYAKPMNGRSVAYDHTGALAAGPASSAPELLLATFDIAALRRARASPEGQERLRPLTRGGDRLGLCGLHRRPEYQRQNAYGRVAGAAV